MTALMLSASLFFVSAQAQTTAQPPAQTKTTPQAVSLVDLLVEGQTLYTLAVDKQPESLTAALELARQAQQAVADETVKKRLGAGGRPDDRDLTVLGALRARISILLSGIEKRREYFSQQYTDIEKMIQRNRLADAHLALDSVPADAPTADPVCPFADLRAELQRLESQAHAKELKSSGSIGNRKWLTQGLVFTAVLAGTGTAAHFLMNDKLDQMSFVPPSSSEWWGLYDNANQLRQVRNGFYAAAVGAGIAVTIYVAVKGSRANTKPSRALAPFGPNTWVGFNIDPKRPGLMVVRVF